MKPPSERIPDVLPIFDPDTIDWWVLEWFVETMLRLADFPYYVAYNHPFMIGTGLILVVIFLWHSRRI